MIFVLNGEDRAQVDAQSGIIHPAHLLKCHGCGVYVGNCPNNVIAIEDEVAVIGDGVCIVGNVSRSVRL